MLSRLITALHLRDLDAAAVIDILVLAFIIYQLLSLIRGTRAVQIMVGVVAVVVVHFLTGPGAVNLPAVHSVLGDLLLEEPRRHALADEPPLHVGEGEEHGVDLAPTDQLVQFIEGEVARDDAHV